MAGASNSINETTTGICGFTGTAFVGTAVTNHAIQVGASTSSTLTSLSVGSTGTVLQGNSGADPSFSTATYPSVATGTGTILRADGTNWVATTATYPATTTAFQLLVSTAASVVGGLTAGSTGQVLTGVTGAVPAFSATPTLTSVTFGSGTALSVYQEGTYTATMVGTVAGSTTYSVQTGYYTKIGNLVTCEANIQGSAATGTGNNVFGALPFTVSNSTTYVSIGVILVSGATWAWPAGTTSATLQATSNTTTASCYISGTLSAGGYLQMTNGAFAFQYTLAFKV